MGESDRPNAPTIPTLPERPQEPRQRPKEDPWPDMGEFPHAPGPHGPDPNDNEPPPPPPKKAIGHELKAERHDRQVP